MTGLKTATPKQVSRFDTIGYNVGGPIWAPGKFNADKSKLFFFFSQEILPTTTHQTPLKFTMPTAAMVSGNFSQLTDNKGVLIPIADPLLTATGKVCKKGGDPGCFPGNIIPANRINANMQKMLALLPAPNFFNNAVSGGNYNYTVSNVRKDPVNQKVLRLDYNLSSRWHAYLRGMDMTVKAQGVQTPASTVTWLTAFPIDYNTRNPNIGANLTYIASSTLINELNLGWAGWTEEQILENPAAELALVQKSTLGMTLGQFNP